MAFLNEYGVAQLWAAMKDRLSGAFNKVDFDVAEAASNLVSGDSIPTAFGKLAKNYSSILTSISDLNTSLGNRISEVNTDLTSKINTKLNKSDVLANYTTTATGKALDASLGPGIKTKMNAVDALSTRLNKVVDVQQGQLISNGPWIDVDPNAYVKLTSITIPADDTRVWIVLAHTESSIGGDALHMASLTCDDSSHTRLYTTRAQSAGGGGLMTWGLVNPDDGHATRTISLMCYGYHDTTHKEVGRIYAFAIANTLHS